MENTAILREDAEHVFSMEEDDLYSLLVPSHVRAQAFSKEGLVAKGREIFAAKLKQLKTTVCTAYKKQGTTVKTGIDLTVLVGSTLLGSPLMAGIPVLPMAALLVKMGLEKFCSSVTT